MNFPRHMANYRGMPSPRMIQGPRMGAPYFPTYNRSRVHQDFEFAENTELRGNAFWVGPLAARDATRKAFHHAKQRRNRNRSFIPMQFPKMEGKVPDSRKIPEEKTTTEDSRDATRNPQNQEVISQPQNSGVPGPDKNSKQKKMNFFRKRAKKSKGAVYNPQNQEATSQPQNSGAAKSPHQPIPDVDSQPQNSKANAAEKFQQPMPKDVSVNPRAANPQQPNPPRVSQQSNADVKQTQNGDNKKREAPGDTRDADLPTHPHKKLRTEETGPPAEQLDVVNKYGLRGDTSTMYSCSLCQYHTMDENLIQIHFLTYKHKMVLKYLRNYLPKSRVNFLNGRLISKMKTSLGLKNNSIHLIRDAFRKISPTHYLHRIEATHCEACGILIPDVPDLLQTHIQSHVHKQNLQIKFRNIKTNSLTAAKNLLRDFEMQRQSKMEPNPSKNIAARSSQGQHPSKGKAARSSQGQNPSKDIAAHSSSVSSAHEILVPEEDDDSDADGLELLVNHNEGPVHGKKDSDNMVIEPDPMTDVKVKEDETEEEAAEAP